jgi:demethylmenaquinone methyltransferase/2-methoxy-6-polyprenyl-1,4-benzoquinol methylase
MLRERAARAAVNGEVGRATSILASGAGWLGASSASPGRRLPEVLHLKLRLLAEAVGIVRALSEDGPLLNVSADSFRVHLARGGSAAAGLPMWWTARVGLASPGEAIPLKIPGSDTPYFLAGSDRLSIYSAATRLRPKREDQPKTEVVASDFCGEMLRFARSKQTKMGIDSDSLVFLEADTTQLPFVDNRFQTVSVAFGLRNVVDTMKGLREMARVCRPGGQVAVLEFSQPTFPGLKQFYQFYFRHVLPRIGNQVAKNSSEAYAYLPQSVSQFPSGEAMAQMMREVPLVSVRYYPMTFGVATLYVGTKPAS